MTFETVLDLLAGPVPPDGEVEYAAFDLRETEWAALGTAWSLRGALELLAADAEDAVGDDADDVLAELADEPAVTAFASVAHRLLAARVLGFLSGPFDLHERFEDSAYTTDLVLPRAGRLVFAFDAAAPNQDQAFCVVERALLAGGADPDLLGGFYDAPVFALGEAIAGADWAIVEALLAAGAPIDRSNRAGDGVVDLLLAAPDYDADRARWLRALGARAHRLARTDLARLLERLPYGDDRELRRVVHQTRWLLDGGADATRALAALLGTYGYYDHEVPAAILDELVRLLLAHNAVDPDGAALAQAIGWRDHGHANYAGVVALLEAR